MATTLYTIGYQGIALEQMLAVLHINRIDRVVDVRDLPLSRRPGFSKVPLRVALNAAGIEYVHLGEAGNPYRRQKGRTERSALLAKYGKHLDGSPTTVRHVADTIRGHRVALLCFEKDPTTCHRSILGPRVADALGIVLHNL